MLDMRCVGTTRPCAVSRLRAVCGLRIELLHGVCMRARACVRVWVCVWVSDGAHYQPLLFCRLPYHDDNNNRYFFFATVLFTLLGGLLVASFLFPRTKDRLAASAGFWALTYGAVNYGLPVGTQGYIYGVAGVTVFVGMVFAWWQGPPQSPRTLQLVELVITAIGIMLVL